MEKEIVNRVANSKLKTFDLEDLYPSGERKQIDIKDWLLEGIVLQEKKFRAAVEAHNWETYSGAYVAVHCSTDAIIPSWAYMLVTTKLQPYATHVILGELSDIDTILYNQLIEKLPVDEYKDLPVIIKGCANKPIPESAYVAIVQKLQPVVKSLMFGEACSSVPLYKKRKT